MTNSTGWTRKLKDAEPKRRSEYPQRGKDPSAKELAAMRRSVALRRRAEEALEDRRIREELGEFDYAD